MANKDNEIPVKLTVDTSQLSDLKNLGSKVPASVETKLNVDDSEVGTAVKQVNDLNTTVTTKINADDSELDTAQGKVDTLIGLQAIDIAISVSGSAISFVESLGKFSGIGGVVEIDNALASIEGRTGRMIPGAEKLITDLYTNGWGESRTAIADTIVEATNLKIAQEDLAEATLTAFQVQSVTGGETNEILRTMDTMVKNNLAPDFETAGNLLVTGFQNGGNRGQDLLDTFNEYGSTFGQLRISGEGALSLINSGLDAGIDNSDRIADSIRETGIRLSEIGTDPNIAAAFTQLDNMSDIDLASQLDAFEAGQISGDEFFGSFFQALADANEKDPTKAKNIAATLVGTIAEDFGTEAISKLSPVWDESMGALEDRAAIAGNTVSGTLGTSIDTLLRTIEQGAVDLLSSEQIDLPGKIQAIKDGITEALSILQSGGTVGEAIEIGLNIPGFNDSVNRFEASIGNFVISILEVIAGIQEFLGKDSSRTRRQIVQAEQEQLPFNLKVANPDEIAGELQTAIDRGLSTSDIAKATGTALEELIAGGELDKAQALVDSLKEVQSGGAMIAPGITGTAFNEARVALQMAEGGDTSRIQEQLDKGNLIAPVSIDTETWQAQIDEAQKMLEQSMLKFGPNLAQPNPLGAFGAEMGAKTSPFLTAFSGGAGKPGGLFGSITTDLDNAVAKITDTQTAATDLDTATATATENTANHWSDLNVSMDDSVGQIITQMDKAAETAELMDARTATALTENTVTASFDMVAESAGTNFPIVLQWFDTTAQGAAELDAKVTSAVGHMSKMLHDLQFLSAQVAQGVTDALQAGANLPGLGAGGGGSTTNNTTVNQTNNNQNNAQTAATTYQIAAALGG